MDEDILAQFANNPAFRVFNDSLNDIDKILDKLNKSIDETAALGKKIPDDEVLLNYLNISLALSLDNVQKELAKFLLEIQLNPQKVRTLMFSFLEEKLTKEELDFVKKQMGLGLGKAQNNETPDFSGN